MDNLTITRILTKAAERQASDLHFSAGREPLLRVDGKLETLAGEPLFTVEMMQELADFFVGEAHQAELAKSQTVTFMHHLENKARFRVHVASQQGQPTVDVRVLTWQVKPVEALGLPKKLVELVGQREGIIIITGPHGSGRTTSLMSLLDLINHQSSRHLVTIEDPVEYQLVSDQSFVQQRDLGSDIPAVRAGLEAVRDEDVEVVGIDVPLVMADWHELLALARAGTLVVVILEADSTVRAIESLATSWPGPEAPGMLKLFGDTLLAAVAQRLVPRLGGGRVLVSECLLATQAVKSLVREGKILQLQSVLEMSRGEGMISLESKLADLVATGEIMRDEAFAQAVHQEALQSLLRVRE